MQLTEHARLQLSSFVTNDPWGKAPQTLDYFGGIVGGEQPSRYSASPFLWNRFFAHIGVVGYFCALDLPRAETLPDLLACMVELPQCVDVTITNPYKTDASNCLQRLPYRTQPNERVGHLGCLNHIIPDHRDGTLHIDNTDGQGMIRALMKRRPLRGARVLLVGAGGAAASIAHELVVAGAELTIANIIARDAAELRNQLDRLDPASWGTTIHAGGWDLIDATAASSDIIVSAITESTPLCEAQIAQLSLDCLCADARYGAKAAFAEAARRAGRPWVDGREMLFGQFELAAERVAELLAVEPEMTTAAFSAIEQEFIA